MPRLLAIFACLFIAPAILAQRLSWKPADFVPLTGYPWDADAGAPMKDVLLSIYREPDNRIRYPVLAAYLRTLPVKKLGAAFNACLIFEGTQCPDDFVDFYLGIWGQRDPEAAMAAARKCFSVMVPDGEPLDLDTWQHPVWKPMNADAFRASSFYLTQVPFSLGHALEAADLPRDKRIRLLQEFSTLAISASGKLPGSTARVDWEKRIPGLVVAFERGEFGLPGLIEGGPGEGFDPFAFDAACVRVMEMMPAKMPEVLAAMATHTPKPVDQQEPTEIPSKRFLAEWARHDYPAMLRWTEEQKFYTSAGTRARALVMSRVDETTRMRWLREAFALKEDDGDYQAGLLACWAQFNPEDALKAAVETRRGQNIRLAGDGCVAVALNASHHALGVIQNLDMPAAIAALTEEERDSLLEDWGTEIMETWIDVDVAEAARYGFGFITTCYGNYFPREKFVRLLSGEDISSDGDIVDRTFCALRFWAIWKPDDMRRWIATVKDAEVGKALTWLHEHAGECREFKSAATDKP